MNRKITIGALILLLGGAIAIAILKTQDEGGAEGAAQAGSTGPAGSGGDGGGGAEGSSAGSGSTKGERARQERDRATAELVEKYGEARTGLSRQVAGNVVSLLDDAIAMGDLMAEGGNRMFGGRGMMIQGVLRGTGVELTEEQKEEASGIYAEFQKRELEKAKGIVNSLKKDPSAMVELFLAGDAKTRGEMSEDEFAQVQSSLGESLSEVINPLDRKNFRGGKPLQDEIFRRDFEALLDDEQAATFETAMTEKEPDGGASDQSGPESSIASLPTMELATLDEAVGSAKKMTAGFRSMMEGMGTLQELKPQIEGSSGEE